MKRINTRFSLLFLFITLTFWNCETDFSLNGEYTVTPVVFGLLDQRDTTHIIIITKAFLGDGDNLVYAQNTDSNYFKQVDAQVIEHINGSPTGRTWQLKDSIIPNKDTDGIFYAPEQKVYVFYESDLDENAEYELIIDINEGQHQAKGITSLIWGVDIPNSIKLSGYTVFFNKPNPLSNEDYLRWNFDVFEGYGVGKYEHGLEIEWIEYYTDGTNQTYSHRGNFSSEEQAAPSKPSTHRAVFDGIGFFQWVNSVVPEDDQVERRVMTNLTLRISAAHVDFNTYLQVSKPVTNIGQVKPTFSNIEGGIGLFSSRHIYTTSNLQLSKASRRELCQGQYTISKKFCSNYSTDFSEPWYCP